MGHHGPSRAREICGNYGGEMRVPDRVTVDGYHLLLDKSGTCIDAGSDAWHTRLDTHDLKGCVLTGPRCRQTINQAHKQHLFGRYVLEPYRLQLLPITGGWRAVDVLCMTEEPYLQTLPAHTIKSIRIKPCLTKDYCRYLVYT